MVNLSGKMDDFLPKKRSAGFSLVELMVVILIIGIIAGFATFKFRGASPVDAAKVASTVAEFARVEALRNGAPARIAIQVDTAKDENHLRKVVGLVAVDDDNNPDTDPVWRIVSIKELPLGTVLHEDFSGALSGDDQKMRLDLDELSENSGTDGENFIYHEFNSIGQCETSFQWVFTTGTVLNGTLSGTSDDDLSGFIIRKTGQTTFFSLPEQISRPS